MTYCHECKYFTDEDVLNGYGRCVARNRAVTNRNGTCVHFEPKKTPLEKRGVLDWLRWHNERAKRDYW